MSMCIYLRYLRLNRGVDCPKEDHPDPICTLRNLETLTVELASHYNLSYGIWRLKKLKHLEMMLCVTSKTIPPDTSGKDCLPNLQILQLVNVKGVIMSSIVNGRFSKLRKLGLEWNIKSKCTEHELLQGLHHLKNLEKLKLVDFKKLTLKAHEFPSKIPQINIKMYDLDELNFSYSFLNSLGELTSLCVLKVTSRGMFSEDSLSLAAKSFPNLEVFHLKGMGVKEWILEKGAMSSLQHLIIKDCNWDELSELWSLTISTIILILILTEQEKHPYIASYFSLMYLS
ncbi:hypothetical protein HN51_052580 [Arachis hypogaea]|nr:uncharacterized protein DS421_17g597060 [Arachis hypogaea]